MGGWFLITNCFPRCCCLLRPRGDRSALSSGFGGAVNEVRDKGNAETSMTIYPNLPDAGSGVESGHGGAWDSPCGAAGDRESAGSAPGLICVLALSQT